MGKSRLDCSRLKWCLTEEGASTRRLEVSRWKTKESSIGSRTELVRCNIELVRCNIELVRCNIELDEIRKVERGLVVQ